MNRDYQSYLFQVPVATLIESEFGYFQAQKLNLI